MFKLIENKDHLDLQFTRKIHIIKTKNKNKKGEIKVSNSYLIPMPPEIHKLLDPIDDTIYFIDDFMEKDIILTSRADPQDSDVYKAKVKNNNGSKTDSAWVVTLPKKIFGELSDCETCTYTLYTTKKDKYRKGLGLITITQGDY